MKITLEFETNSQDFQDKNLIKEILEDCDFGLNNDELKTLNITIEPNSLPLARHFIEPYENLKELFRRKKRNKG